MSAVANETVEAKVKGIQTVQNSEALDSILYGPSQPVPAVNAFNVRDDTINVHTVDFTREVSVMHYNPKLCSIRKLSN